VEARADYASSADPATSAATLSGVTAIIRGFERISRIKNERPLAAGVQIWRPTSGGAATPREARHGLTKHEPQEIQGSRFVQSASCLSPAASRPAPDVRWFETNAHDPMRKTS
jgi:hypothetical protein